MAMTAPPLQEPWPASIDLFICPDGIPVPSVFKYKNRNKEEREYQIVSWLGKGAFGRCFEVKNLREPSMRNRACKTLDKITFTAPKVVDRVKSEMRVMRKLPMHENVVALYDVFEDPERLCFLMEMCTSLTLHDLLQRRKRLTEFEARYFMYQLSCGMAALHDANIIHRDIKHSNLLLDSMNRIKICDFGMSVIIDAKSDRKTSFLGTPNFLAPEMVTREGRGHSFGVDVWAAGIMLYVMLYGRAPFNAPRTNVPTNDIKALYRKIVSDGIVFPPDSQTSDLVCNLINKLCCKDEERRISARDIPLDAWYSMQTNEQTPGYMPRAIFHRPINNMDEYNAMVFADRRAGTQTVENVAASARALVGASEKIFASDKRPVRRQPLESIPENGNRPLPSAISAGGSRVYKDAAPAAGAGAHVLRQQPAVPSVVRLGARSLAEAQTSHGYSLRARNVKPDSTGNGVSSGSAARLPTRDYMRSPLANRSHVRFQLHAPNSTPSNLSCQVNAEFGRVAKLSEEYIPSILEWKTRLQKFCQQTELYLRQPSKKLEYELSRIPEHKEKYPRVGIYVVNWMVMARYGLGFRLSDKSMGTLFNDNTSLLNDCASNSYVYVRPFENRSSIGYYSNENFPVQLDKKRRLLGSFAQKITKSFSAHIDRDICPHTAPSRNINCLLQAVSTNIGMVFMLTGNVLQFNMRNHSKLFLYRDAHIFYKDADGHKWHFDIEKGPAMLIRNTNIDIEQFLLCLGYAQKVVATWNLPSQKE
ncbi:Cell cycle serine/threonine-protein kinase cdc5/MSD2 [Kickxella alabastrina]|uniref:Cell cycle serine/threonine-protein kinase cdc5/MSD2 n=1 Tax=Kickxella alabastrina TaxID=61397 RepID=A0ACC1ILM0_9FUNG|nr:Cell cycle serine/threonine-protein kinase cdc5/MSD2 [Kickxella alabastrina]